MRLFTLFNRNILRYKILLFIRSGIIIRPAMYGWQFAGPVSVNMLHRGSPFQSIRTPRILRCFWSAENTVEEVQEEYPLRHRCDDGKHRNNYVQIDKRIEHRVLGIIVITSRCTGQTSEVHREKHTIPGDNC